MIVPGLEALVPEQRAYNAQIMEATAGLVDVDTSTLEGLTVIREAMAPGGLFGFRSLEQAEELVIQGPGGPLVLRVLRAERPDGVYLHLHGGGMCVGSAAGYDATNARLVEAANVTVVSVEYRLAPEHPYPAGPDDAEAAAWWLVEHAAERFGSDRLVMGGDSAGAYLAALTMVRLRDRRGSVPPYRGLDLRYGMYDYGGTPAFFQLAGKVPHATGDPTNRGHYLPGRSAEACRVAAISPLWADLADLPPALLTVGTADFLVDDSLFMAARLSLAGNDVALALYPEGPHGIDVAPTAMGQVAFDRIAGWVRSRLAD